MAISPIGPVLNATGINSVAGVNPTATTNATGAASGNFGNTVVNALQNLENTQQNADNLAIKAATGDLNDVHDYMIAATEASVQTQLTVAIRNKAVDAFNEIMRMQI